MTRTFRVLLLSGAFCLGREALAQSPMFLGDPTHQGRYPATLKPELMGLQWRFDTDGGVVSSAAVLGDTVWIGSADGRLLALDRLTGKLRWQAQLASPVSSSPAVVGGRVIVGTRDGRFHAVRSGDGGRIWSVATGPDMPFPWGHESGDVWTSSPVVSGNTAFAGSGDGKLYAFDLATGRVRWRAATEGRIRSTPAVAGGRVYVGSADGSLYAFDQASGAPRWRFRTVGDTLHSGNFGYDRRTIQSSPVVAGDLVLIGARDGFLYAVDAASGALRWRFDHEISWVNGSAAIADGVAYVGTSDGHFVQAVSLADGSERWRTKTESSVWGSAAISGDQLVFGEGSGRITSLDRATGAVRWTFQTGAAVEGSPVPAGALVIVGSLDGGIYALRTGDRPVHRAVYFDTAGRIKPAAAESTLARAMAGRGYRTLGAADSLVRFLEARIGDRVPSVVVFAMEHLPPATVTEPFESSLLRRYLAAGGKVVWTRMPPLLYPRSAETGARPPGGLGQFRWDDPGRLLGMAMREGIFDPRLAVPTEAGRRWGLSGRWREGWGIAPSAVTEALALDDWGLAPAWVRSYGGPPGTGFVRAPTDEVRMIYYAAEYRPEPAARR